MPIAGGAAGHGGMAHAANEYFVIEGAGKVYGMAGAEKSVATILYNFAHAGRRADSSPVRAAARLQRWQVISVRDLVKTYHVGDVPVHALSRGIFA